MPFVHHVFTTLRILTKPSVVVPNLTVRSVANINFTKLREAGYGGVVIDRDNCLTRPRQDILIPALNEAWSDCLKSFGPERVLIVSNSAGTSKDASFLQAEAVTRNLGAPVLLHDAPKPFVVKPILHYFASLPPLLPPTSLSSPSGDSASASSEPTEPPKAPPPRLVVIGDRLSTDIVLSHRLPNAYGIWTRKVWQEESFGVRVVRILEDGILAGVTAWTRWRRKRRGLEVEDETGQQFVKEETRSEEPIKTSWWASSLAGIRSLFARTT